MHNFEEVNIKDFTLNPFEIKHKWMLISAAKPDGTINTMTASWGGFGIMWNKDVVFIVIRPQRYTKEFIDSAESFSLTFFDKSHLKALGYLGKVSGRDENKIAKVDFTTLIDNSIPYFEEAESAIFAKKLYAQPMGEHFFLDAGKENIEQWYPQKDFHILYVGEITKILEKAK